MSTISKKDLIVGGISVHVHSRAALAEEGRPLAVLFLLHGRHDSSRNVEGVTERVLELAQSHGPGQRELIVVTFDHRNHGSRVVNPKGNDDWKSHNERHAVDMYAIQMGTASDISFLIDFLPVYLLPSGEREIHEWMVSGISLGGHSTWIALRHEPRVKIGIPIIGCPEYLSLMVPRAQASGLAVGPPHFPPSLMDIINSRDPSSVQASSNDPSQNPFLGKHILVLCGAADKLVPWKASESFVQALQVGNGSKKVIIEENAGHECTPRMTEALANFVWEHGLRDPLESSY